ncbi:Peptidase S8 and S53 subtilisin kexin sedolisin [uncultured Paludibacter sp.]|nr:Peptidase S8 and S53 subtilisin kexin sedolisin [uncultured Paludibacter sp.]
MKNKYAIFLIVFLSCFLYTKAVGYYFYIQFKDKNGTPYTLNNPSAYLTQRALDRRTFFDVAIDSTDLPVNQSYVAQIQALNLTIHCRTKWMNGITVTTGDSSLIIPVQNLSFVKFVQYTGKTNASGSLISRRKLIQETATTDYGAAATQINQLNGAILHDNGYRGQGIHIAVIDAGFNNANTNPGFDSLRSEGRLLGVKNFVNPSVSVYAENAHGSNVLSTMAGNIPNTYVGTAPKASYWLLQSEANNTETLAEPDFWISAIEFADSVGVDLSTTSLGYTVFDDSTMNFTYADMNGKTARASIAATMAAQKGIMVLNSAGNSGNSSWHYIGVPADADKIITVGAVTNTGIPSTFSSYGPTSDGRIKPELCAMGTSSALIDINGTVSYGNGTSYSCPILGGMTACFLQAAKNKQPTLSLAEIRDILYQSANYYSAPTSQMGYGIPNFQTAYNQLTSLATKNNFYDENVTVFVNKQNTILSVLLNQKLNRKGVAKLFTLTGNQIQNQIFEQEKFNLDIQVVPAGIYILNLNFDGKTINKKVMIR